MAIVLDAVKGALTDDFKKNKYARVDIYGIIDKEMGRRVSRQIDNAVDVLHEPGKIIFIFIDSKGGSLYAALQVVDAINRAKRHCVVATVVNTLAFSAAVPIFQSADEGFRFIAPDGQLMIHQATLRDVQPRSQRQSREDDEHLRKLQRRLHEIMTAVYCKNRAAMIHKFLDDLRAHSKIDWFLSADEAMQYGLADHKEVPAFMHDFEYKGRVVLRGGQTLAVPDKVYDLAATATTASKNNRHLVSVLPPAATKASAVEPERSLVKISTTTKPRLYPPQQLVPKAVPMPPSSRHRSFVPPKRARWAQDWL